MSYLPSPSATQWTIRNIVSTRTVQCWIGLKRESFVEAWTPHCRSSQMRTSTTCFSGLSQTVTTSTTMCGLMLTLSMSMDLLSCIGLTDNLPALVSIQFVDFKILIYYSLYLLFQICMFVVVFHAQYACLAHFIMISICLIWEPDLLHVDSLIGKRFYFVHTF